MNKVGVVVIGGGPAGYVLARRLGQMGIDTVLVEREHLGGTCLNRGCIPTKALYAATVPLGKKEVYARMGLDVEIHVELSRLRAFVSGVVEKLRDGIAHLLSSAKVEVLRGEGRLRGPGEVEVIGESRSEKIQAKAVVLATGSVPVELPFLPFDGEKIWSSDHALQLPLVPERMVVVGGGVVGLELATLYRRLGAKVVVVEMMDSLLPGVGLSRRGVAFLMQALLRQGIEIRLNTAAVGLTKSGLLVRGTREEEIGADVILVAVGRRPRSEGLGLEKLGVQVEKGIVRTDSCFLAAPGIYAIGDLRGGALLAHKASHEGLLLAETLGLELRGQKPSSLAFPRAMPWAVFTQPEIALVGAPVETPGLKVARFPFSALGRAWAEGEPEGFVTFASDEAGKIVGIEIIGPHATELIGEGLLAVELGLSLGDLARAIHPHPTFTEALWETALYALGRPLHFG
ncbi:MAG: dihydrolipoyl dehydrogenase [Candidatus Bipolaricaulota bacterium]|nr:dihydrolipoyl dehydrogenase [Candidatus Bipolaricaulota bacterium]MDW8126613.1 dihydrolipoyl dehydrogenase [Candidatus Bipolaricaulota bacterium]